MGTDKVEQSITHDWIHGDAPTTPVVMAACDSKYFLDHGPAFIASADKAGMDCHIHVVNPTDDVFTEFEDYSKKVDVSLTLTYSKFPTEQIAEQDGTRTYYACLRFLVAPFLLQNCKKMLILDIDCVIMKPFEFPEKPLAYFPREPIPGTVGWESEGTTVAAGAVYYDIRATNAAVAVSETIKNMPLRWFVDQIALSRVFNAVDSEHVHHFDSQFMDWEFIEGTTIWTGKGPRKYDNPTYVAKKKEFAECLL